MKRQVIVAVVGPTGVGKTALGIHLARAFGGEVVNGDSRQIYRYTNIGTAKPSEDQQAFVPHHLIDIRNPDDEFSLALFIDLANQAITEIHSRGSIPIVVGGSGQYMWGLLEGWEIPRVSPNNALRADLELQAEKRGGWVLYQLLEAVDPLAAKKIDRKNIRRIIRALEVHFTVGSATLKPSGSTPRKERILMLGLTSPRSRLYNMVDDRVDKMMACGFLDEVRNLLKSGYVSSVPGMSGVGYRELAAHLSGDLSHAEAVSRIKTRTHAIVRRQYSWFGLDDPRINWIRADGSELQAGEQIAQEFLSHCDKIS